MTTETNKKAMCSVCKKSLCSISSLRRHERSKKHLANAEKLKRNEPPSLHRIFKTLPSDIVSKVMTFWSPDYRYMDELKQVQKEDIQDYHRVLMAHTLKLIRNGGTYPLYPHQVVWVNDDLRKGRG